LCEGAAAAFFIKIEELVEKCEAKEYRQRVYKMGNILLGIEDKDFLGADVDEELCVVL